MEEARVAGEPVSLRARLDLSPTRHQIELHYTALGFLAPERIEFGFHLEGLDEDWGKPPALGGARVWPAHGGCDRIVAQRVTIRPADQENE